MDGGLSEFGHHHPLGYGNGAPQSSHSHERSVVGRTVILHSPWLTDSSLPKPQNHLSRSLQHIPEDLFDPPLTTWVHTG